MSAIVGGVKDTETAVNYYSTASGHGIDTLAAHWQSLNFVVESQAVSSANRGLIGKRTTSASGWDMLTTGTNSSLQFRIANDVGGSVTLSSSIAASELNKIFCAVLAWDGSKMRQYLRRVEVGVGSSALAGHLIDATSPYTFGGLTYVGTPFRSQGVRLIGSACGAGAIVLSQVQALHDAVLANDGWPQRMPGGDTQHLWVFPRDVATAPLQIDDQIGNHHLTIAGALPAVAPTYSRAFAW